MSFDCCILCIVCIFRCISNYIFSESSSIYLSKRTNKNDGTRSVGSFKSLDIFIRVDMQSLLVEIYRKYTIHTQFYTLKLIYNQ